MMMTKEDLIKAFFRLDGKGYKAYKDIRGVYDYLSFTLSIDHVQGDPFASPSRISVKVSSEKAGFMRELWSTKAKKIALQDYLSRTFHLATKRICKGRRGIGKSGLIAIDTTGQEILERSSVVVRENFVEVRFIAGLPASGRTILGRDAAAMFSDEIPRIVAKSLFLKSLSFQDLKRHLQAAENQDYLRNKLEEKGLVCFIGNGSLLPRRSGIDDRPMELMHNPVPFHSPPEFKVSMSLPDGDTIEGMGIPRGVTLIVGGGFHGKSTLLNAIERSVYNHIPGDGRENVVTVSSAVKIRAEDGRFVEKVNIEPFISNLPLKKDTKRFSTQNSSGSTSQAANIVEAVEIGSKLLLIDEDTSSTNFMIRDERMQELVSKDKEPITPFIDKVRKLYNDFGVSTIIVMGGSGDYFDVADTIIMMDAYRPVDATTQAKKIAEKHSVKRKDEGGTSFGTIVDRQVLPESFNPSRGRRDVKIDAKGLKTIVYGDTTIDLSYLEQLVDISQTRCIGFIIHYLSEHYLKGSNTLKKALTLAMRDIQEKGLDILLPYKSGNLALPRVFEVSAAINRMRTLRVK